MKTVISRWLLVVSLLLLVVSLAIPKSVLANYAFSPTGGGVILGTQVSGATSTIAAAEGTSIGGWRGAIADDNFHWAITSTVTGYNAYLDLDNVQENGANSIIVQSEFDFDATIPQSVVQICDWSTATGVDNVADAQCTGGGWRTLNNRNVVINTATATAYQWQIYNGYWTTATPLANFINSSSNNKVRIRYFSSTNTTSVVNIDYLRIQVVINPVYEASSFVNLGTGVTTGDYRNTNAIYQGASDNAYSGAAGTAGSVANFYYAFNNIKTYFGMNTILVRAEYGCDAIDAAATYRPKIYNFSTASWEDLTTASITCTTTDATNAWAKNNVNIGDYISNGQIRVGFRSLVNTTRTVRTDLIYIMLGTTNTDVSTCEISIGSTGSSSTSCSSTRNLDMTGVGDTWIIATENESTTMADDYYPFDTDADAIATEEAMAGHVKLKMGRPTDGMITGTFFAGRFAAGAAGTVQLGMRDYSGSNTVTGGFTAYGASATTTLVYTDNITVATVTNGGMAGYWDNPEDYIHSLKQEAWIRLRTTTDGGAASNSIASWDFAMLSLQWTEDPTHVAKTYQFAPTGNGLVVGSTLAITAQTGAATEGVNTGSWKGTLADDNFHWGTASTTSGINVYLDTDYVQLNGANTIIVQSEFDLDATVPNIAVQICDWTTASGVDNAADGQCTGGGWRTLNTRNVAITTVTPTAYHWQLYNGYWTTATPLSNFINTATGPNRVRIRYYSTTNTTSQLNIDYLRLQVVISPVYQAGSFVNLGTGVTANTYKFTTNFGQAGSDNQYATAAGTAGSVADFYFGFNNIKTYTGMNTILVRAEYSCSAINAAQAYRPKIYNFNSSSWEDLTTTNITCTTTDATNAWALNNVTIGNYISGGQVRVGFRGTTNYVTAIRVDLIYIILGTTNADTANCEISYGSGTATNCDATRNLDMTSTLGAGSTWPITTRDESTTDSATPYASDWDGDAAVEEAAAGNVRVGLTVPNYGSPVSIFNAFRFNTGVGATASIRLKDYSGQMNTAGGFSVMAAGATASNTMAYFDNISLGGVANGGWAGFGSNPHKYVNEDTGEAWVQMVTTADGATANNAIYSWDFAFYAFAWIEPAYSIMGNIYTDEGATLYGCNSDNLTVSARLKGSSLYQGVCFAANGYYAISDIGSTDSGDILTVYLDGETPKANAVTRTHGQAKSVRNLDLYQNRVILRHEDNGPITNTDIAIYDSTGDSDVRFSASGSGYTGVAGSKIYLGVGESWVPGGNVETPSFYSNGTFTLAGNILTLRSGGGGSDCSAVDGTMMPLCVGNSATATFNAGSVNYEGQVGTTIYNYNYKNLGVGTSSEAGIGTTFTITGNMDIAGTLTIGGPSSTNNDILAIGSNTVNLLQNIVAMARNVGNLAGSGTVNYLGTSATTMAGANYYNLGVGTSSEAGVGVTYTLGAGTTVNNVLTIGNASSTNTDVLSGGNQTIVLMLSGDPWNITTKGSFTPGNGTVSYQGTSNTTVERMTYYNLYVAPASGTPSYTFTGSGNIVTANDLNIGGGGKVNFDVETQDVNIGVSNNFIIGVGNTYNASSSASLNIGGSIAITGYFAKNTSTVTLDTPSKVSVLSYGVGQTFYNLTIGVTGKTIRFDNINRTVVANNFSVNAGSSCTNPVLLYSDSDGNQWDLQVLGAATVNYAQIKDSNAINALTANQTVNATNNTNWTINSGSCNAAPSLPTSLAQKKTDDTNLVVGTWVNQDTIKFSANATDPNVADTLQLCVEKKNIATGFTNSEDFCGPGVAYSGVAVGVAVTVPGISENEYHWQVRVKDAGGLYSSWLSFGGNGEASRDFGIDTSPPTGGTIYDGDQAGIDLNYNSGGLDTLYANWSGINANISGLTKVEYAVGTAVGSSDVVNWTSVGTGSTAWASGLSLNTSSKYYFAIKATDAAGNIGDTAISNGLQVSPTLIFSASPSTITFSNLNSGNNYTSSAGTTLTISTNAYSGYVIRAATNGLLQAGSYTIGNFNGGSYASPDGWQSGDRGFGYTSSDSDIQGINKFSPASCAGGNAPPCYAPFSQTTPGDIVADHTANISGSPVSNETFTIEYKVQTENTQAAASYSTTVIYTIIPDY